MPDDQDNLTPFVPESVYFTSASDFGTRLVVTTNEDRIETFKRILDLYSGPFFITVVVQLPHRGLEKPGRLYSEGGKSRIQIDYFLDYFQDFLLYDGFIHIWITCQESNGIVVYDQHDTFFIYEREKEAADYFAKRGFREAPVSFNFRHAHQIRNDIYPGSKELADYGKWWWRPLELSDVEDKSKKSLRNLYLKIRSWRIRRLKQKRKKV